MEKQTNILIVGYGSAGKRHYQNLMKLGYRTISVFDTDKGALTSIPRAFSEWKDADFADFEIAFICTPNHMHMQSALLAARAGCHLFIEKPLADRLSEARRLAKMCEERNLTTLVGCNLRFHPCLAFMFAYIQKKRLGDVYGIHHEFGYYLPRWREGSDYRTNYAVKKHEGGGIILDDIHEFDLLFWFAGFSKVKKSKFMYSRSGSLESETEDNCVASFKFENGSLGSVRCDYLQQRYSRTCKIVGEKGNLFWDFHENTVWLETEKQRRNIFSVRNYDVNSMYVDEVAYFLDCAARKRNTENDVRRALHVLRYCVERR